MRIYQRCLRPLDSWSTVLSPNILDAAAAKSSLMKYLCSGLLPTTSRDNVSPRSRWNRRSVWPICISKECNSLGVNYVLWQSVLRWMPASPARHTCRNT